MLQLIRKYNRPTPRYTSYPSVPMWTHNPPDETEWKASVKKSFMDTRGEGVSLYVHLPFCEELCTYCACNKRITKNHKVESDYIDALLAEWHLYFEIFGERPKIREIHLGGGTPTFFQPENLRRLLTGIYATSEISEHPDFSFEGHPNNTTKEHLEVLHALGFNRVSFGIQDLNQEVQIAINRIQPFENVQQVTAWAREIGYRSVNFDFVYGLPFQHSKNLMRTLQTALTLAPDRIAFYSYAHVPWLSGGQRAYDESDLPHEIEKVNMYLMGRQIFKDRGYVDIGMDHFAFPHDSLVQALNNNNLHRNFMGYTECPGDLLIGLGCSAISDSRMAYVQNEKVVEKYQERVFSGSLPLLKGHHLSQEDFEIKEKILEIACRRALEWSSIGATEASALQDLESDGIIRMNDHSFEVTEQGIIFLRNVCAVFDRHSESVPEKSQFSRVI